LKDTALHALWDLAEMKKVALADGRSFDEMLQEIQDALNELNVALLEDPHYAGMMAIQDEVEVEYEVGASNGVEEATEYGRPSPKRGATSGHSLPIKNWDRAFGWTMLALPEMRATKLTADVRSGIRDIRNHFQQRALRRFFLDTAETVGATSGASVPLADGGTADSTYVPPQSSDGEVFANTHDHFLRHAAISDANVKLAIRHLQEHGHQGPFEIVASQSDAATWQGLTGFKKPEWAGIVYHASATERAAIEGVEMYAGYYESPWGIARIWLTSRVPTNYYGVFKSYGEGDPRNPLRMRINPTFGYGWQVVPGIWVNAPELMAVLLSKYEFGIGEDRTNGVCVFIAGNGDYTAPTIS
jgi:hypothetical protein